MKVRTAALVGVLLGIIFGRAYPIQLEMVAMLVTVLSVLGLVAKKQVMKGPFWGLVCGVLSGYGIYVFLTTYGI